MLTMADELLDSSIRANSSSITQLSTQFTSATSLLNVNTLSLSSGYTLNAEKISALAEDTSSLKSSINSLSSMISTLSTATGGGGMGVIINPTEQTTVFSAPVIYSGVNDRGNTGPKIHPFSNTYLNGVMWVNARANTFTETSADTMPCVFENCVIFNGLHMDNCDEIHIIGCSADNLYIDNAGAASIENNTINNIYKRDVTTCYITNGSYGDVNAANCGNILCIDGTIDTININGATAVTVSNNAISKCMMDMPQRLSYQDNTVYGASLYMLPSAFVSSTDTKRIAGNEINSLLITCSASSETYVNVSSEWKNGMTLNYNTINIVSINYPRAYTIASNRFFDYYETAYHSCVVSENAINRMSLDFATRGQYIAGSGNYRVVSCSIGTAELGNYTDSAINTTRTGATPYQIYFQYNTITSYAQSALFPMRMLGLVSSADISVGNEQVSLMVSCSALTFSHMEGFPYVDSSTSHNVFLNTPLQSLVIHDEFVSLNTPSVASFDLYCENVPCTDTMTIQKPQIGVMNLSVINTTGTNVPSVRVFQGSIGSMNMYLTCTRNIYVATVDRCSNTFVKFDGDFMSANMNTFQNLNIDGKVVYLISNSINDMNGRVSALYMTQNTVFVRNMYYNDLVQASNTFYSLTNTFPWANSA